MPIAHLTKFIATYPRKFWKEKGYSGEAYHWPLYSGGQAAPVCLVFDASLTNGSPALVGFVGGKRAADFNKLEVKILLFVSDRVSKKVYLTLRR